MTASGVSGFVTSCMHYLVMSGHVILGHVISCHVLSVTSGIVTCKNGGSARRTARYSCEGVFPFHTLCGEFFQVWSLGE